MAQEITTLPPTTQGNSSTAVSPAHLSAVGLLFFTFLVGAVGNGLYLWVLGLKMRRTVTTLWFLHLVSCYFLFTLLIPFFTLYILLGFHWVFGSAMCKLLNTCISVGMFCSVFLLTLISLDRYTLVCKPIWSRQHRTMSRARKLVAGVWLVSFALSAPYLFFRKTHVVDGGKIKCINNYALSGDGNRTEVQEPGRQTHQVIFVIRILLGFLLPFCTIVGCYSQVRLEMKDKAVAWTRKPFKVLVAAVASFFLGWLPYHLYQGLNLYAKDLPESVTGALLVIYTFTTCFTAGFSPILYLFVGENFWQVFRTSLPMLVKEAFVDELGSSAHESSLRHRSEFEMLQQNLT